MGWGLRDVQRYLTYVRDQARQRFDAGMDDEAAADDIDIADFRDWSDPERLAANVANLYREFDWSLPWPWAPTSPLEHLALGPVGFTVIDVALVYFVVAGQITAIGRALETYRSLPPSPAAEGTRPPTSPGL